MFVWLVIGVVGVWWGGWIVVVFDGLIIVLFSEVVLFVIFVYVLLLFWCGFWIDWLVWYVVMCLLGFGVYVLSINGCVVLFVLFNLGWIDYCKIVLYEMIDVIDWLWIGDNMLGVMFGGGMYDVLCVFGCYGKFVGLFGVLKLIV